MPLGSSDVLPPSGTQHVIEHGSAEAVVTEVGATLRSYTVDRTPVIDGFAVSDLCTDGRGQVLAPWPNRLGDGRYRFGDRQGSAALDEPNRHNAIHGLVRWVPWQMRSRAQNSVTLACVLEPQPGYPWRLELQVEYHLGRQGLSVRANATNLDSSLAPFGIGFHPYLAVAGGNVDSARLEIPAHRYVRNDDRGLPMGEGTVTGSEFDFRVARPVGPTRLDTAFTELHRDSAGMATVALCQPERGQAVSLWMDGAFRYVMVYSADSVHDPERRRRALAVEPMTCPPDALRSGTDLLSLVPGETWSGAWGISPS